MRRVAGFGETAEHEDRLGGNIAILTHFCVRRCYSILFSSRTFRTRAPNRDPKYVSVTPTKKTINNNYYVIIIYVRYFQIFSPIVARTGCVWTSIFRFI